MVDSRSICAVVLDVVGSFRYLFWIQTSDSLKTGCDKPAKIEPGAIGRLYFPLAGSSPGGFCGPDVLVWRQTRVSGPLAGVCGPLTPFQISLGQWLSAIPGRDHRHLGDAALVAHQ